MARAWKNFWGGMWERARVVDRGGAGGAESEVRRYNCHDIFSNSVTVMLNGVKHLTGANVLR
jgi:hypothetical protein